MEFMLRLFAFSAFAMTPLGALVIAIWIKSNPDKVLPVPTPEEEWRRISKTFSSMGIMEELQEENRRFRKSEEEKSQ